MWSPPSEQVMRCHHKDIHFHWWSILLMSLALSSQGRILYAANGLNMHKLFLCWQPFQTKSVAMFLRWNQLYLKIAVVKSAFQITLLSPLCLIALSKISVRLKSQNQTSKVKLLQKSNDFKSRTFKTVKNCYVSYNTFQWGNEGREMGERGGRGEIL